MDAWEKLVSGSTIASGDAWEHLQSQGGGGSVMYVSAIDGQISAGVMQADIAGEIIAGDISNAEMQASILNDTITITIEHIDMQGSIAPQTLGGDL